MKVYWQIVITVEALLFLLVCYQLLDSPIAVMVSILAVITLIFGLKKERRTSFNQFQIMVSAIVLILALLINAPAIWAILIIGIVAVGLKGIDGLRFPFMSDAQTRKNEFLMIETVEPEQKDGRRFKRKWFSTIRIGDTIYEWDDINMTLVSGDTIIDLGNTLLPREDNVILIRKVFGRTRVLVPVGIGVSIEHAALRGNLILDDQLIKLKNDSVKVFSEDYSTSQRRLKIVTNTLVGDLEVIRI